jgi:hypothetical protein
MVPMTILVDEAPKCVVRPNDMKGLQRFLRNGKPYLLAEKPEGAVTWREAVDAEKRKWRDALDLHRAWGGEEEDFFGVPL